MSRTCGTYGGRRGFFWGDLREEDHLENPGIDGIDLRGVGLGIMDACKCGNEPMSSTKFG